MGGNLRKKDIRSHNIYSGTPFKRKEENEIFENILQGKKIQIERILSSGQITPGNKWLSDRRNEWVLLLQGKSKILFESGDKLDISRGDYFLIPAGTRHKVLYTSKKPYCIWLTIYYK